MVTLVNRAKMTTATTGTEALTLGAASDGFQSFADAGVADGDVVRYVIEDGNAWEIGLGTYTSSGTTLTRQVLESSAGGSAINLSGNATVFVAAAGADFLSTPQSSANDGQMDLSLSSYFKAALTTDTFFQPVNPLAGETAQTSLLEVTGSTITRNSDVNNAEPQQVQVDLNSLLSGFSGFNAARFSPDGTRLFVADDSFGVVSISQLDLSTAFDLSTVSDSGVRLVDSNAWAFGVVGSLVFSDDGLRLFVSDRFGSEVAQYTLATAYDLSSATYDTTVLLPEFLDSGIRFSTDGTQLFGAGLTSINSYSLGTAFDLSTLNPSATASYSFGSDNLGGVQCFEFSDDGTALFVGVAPSDTNAPSVQYSLGTAFDLTTMSLDGGVEVVFDDVPQDLSFSDDGFSFFVTLEASQSTTILQYTCTAAFDVAGATPALVRFNLPDSGTFTSNRRPVRFSADGSKMFVGEGTNVFQFSLSASFDLRTASYDGISGTFSDGPLDFAFSNDGTKLFTTVGATLRQFSLGSAYDLSSVTEDASSYPVSEINFPEQMAFNGDGTKLYLGGITLAFSGGAVAEYTLGTAFRLDSVTFEGLVAQDAWDFSVYNQPLLFSHDGTRIFSIGPSRVTELFLPTPYDVSSGVVVENSFSAASEFNELSGAAFSATGDTLFLAGRNQNFDLEMVSYDTQVTDNPLMVFPSSFKFAGGTAPSGPSTAAQTALFSLSTSDEGTTFFCRKLGDFS